MPQTLLIDLNFHWAWIWFSSTHSEVVLVHFHGITRLLILFISRFSIVTDTAPDREREDQTHTSTILSKNASHVFSHINTINSACLFLVWVQPEGIRGFVIFLLLYHDQIWTHVSVEQESHVLKNETAPGNLCASLCLAKLCWKMETRGQRKTIS